MEEWNQFFFFVSPRAVTKPNSLVDDTLDLKGRRPACEAQKKHVYFANKNFLMLVFLRINRFMCRIDMYVQSYHGTTKDSNQRTSGVRAHFYPLSCVYIHPAKSCIIYHSNSGHFTTSENEWNRRNTTKLVFPSLCPLKSRGEDFKNGFQTFQFS